MFTGLVQTIGTVVAQHERGGDVTFDVDYAGLDLDGAVIGESIAVNGVCLTAVTLGHGRFTADVSRETLGLTNLGGLRPGDKVNLERSLRAGEPLGGHLVSGHVDTTTTVLSRRDDARSVRLEIALPGDLGRYVARKGSVCLDGVSLTVNEVSADRFGVNIVPHTLEATIIGGYEQGTVVNMEVDLIARYLEQMRQYDPD